MGGDPSNAPLSKPPNSRASSTTTHPNHPMRGKQGAPPIKRVWLQDNLQEKVPNHPKSAVFQRNFRSPHFLNRFEGSGETLRRFGEVIPAEEATAWAQFAAARPRREEKKKSVGAVGWALGAWSATCLAVSRPAGFSGRSERCTFQLHFFQGPLTFFGTPSKSPGETAGC